MTPLEIRHSAIRKWTNMKTTTLVGNMKPDATEKKALTTEVESDAMTVLTAKIDYICSKISATKSSGGGGGGSGNGGSKAKYGYEEWRKKKTTPTVEKEGRTWHWCPPQCSSKTRGRKTETSSNFY